MKVISWNIGNFIWAKYLKKSRHYGFDIADLPKIIQLIKPEDADVIFLQEVRSSDDIIQICQALPEFTHHIKVQIDDVEHDSLFLSKFPIKEIKHTLSNDYIINGITFFPIHFNAYSPTLRFKQAKELLPDLPNKKGVILGDTNFWIFFNLFLSRRDKIAYNAIIENHTDLLQNFGPTNRAFLSFDKFFVTKDLQFSNVKLTKHKIAYIDHYMISAEIN